MKRVVVTSGKHFGLFTYLSVINEFAALKLEAHMALSVRAIALARVPELAM